MSRMENNPTAISVANEVRAAMGRRRVTGPKLAQALGVSYSALARRLTATVPFDIVELAAIAKILDIPLSTLLVDVEVAS